jgi:hypothetical protein
MLFPKWANRTPLLLGAAGLVVGVGAVTAFVFVISPYSTQVGYAPRQPVPYSHKIHAGNLGMDCRYCHAAVERSPVAMVPPSATCMNCHTAVRPDSPNTQLVRESVSTGSAVPWVRIHHLPDFVYFDHSVHVNAGVGCETCHGRIDQMETVFQARPLNMAWCLDCHRAPENYVRPLDAVTVMGYVPEGGDQRALGAQLVQAGGLHPPVDCAGCHR